MEQRCSDAKMLASREHAGTSLSASLQVTMLFGFCHLRCARAACARCARLSNSAAARCATALRQRSPCRALGNLTNKQATQAGDADKGKVQEVKKVRLGRSSCRLR